MAENTTVEEKFEFQAEVGQLLNIITHSVYTEKEVFLRELVSNASDACDKLHYQELLNADIQDKGIPIEIKIETDKKKKIITVSDTGIGMTKEELVKNIGSIAHSGSGEFFKKLSEAAKKDVQLIGQFGIGFYSVYMIAKEVRIKTLSHIPGSEAWEWCSQGTGTYTVKPTNKKTRGTSIEIHLNDDASEYAEKDRIEGIIKKHSNFVAYPVLLEGKVVNEIKAIWAQPKSQVTEEEYKKFYQFISNQNDEPLLKLHVSADAPIQFNSILFFPQRTFEVFGFGEEEHGLSLYSKKVVIQNHCKDILPKYLRFVWGMVDSDDIPLNISRETLQENRIIMKIKSILVRKILDELLNTAEKEEKKYLEIWKAFGKILREGITLDFQNKEKLSKLLRFNSSASKDALTSLPEYVKRMKENQKEIYYAGGASREAIESSAHIEIFKKREIEVFYLTDPVDEFVMSAVGNFEEKPIKSIDMKDVEIAKEALPVNEDKEESLAFKSAFDGLLKKTKEILGEKVTEVKESTRLTDSPCCLVNPDAFSSSHMQKIMQMSNKDFHDVPKMILEINRHNKLIKNLTEIFKNDSNDPFIAECSKQLYENSLMSDGIVNNVHETIPRIQQFMEKASESIINTKSKVAHP